MGEWWLWRDSVTLRTVCLAPLRKALQFSQRQIDLGALSQPQWILVILLCCKLKHPFSKQQLFIFWTPSWLLFKIQVIYSHYKIFPCNFRVEKDFYFSSSLSVFRENVFVENGL